VLESTGQPQRMLNDDKEELEIILPTPEFKD
jgi:hypothetical protein